MQQDDLYHFFSNSDLLIINVLSCNTSNPALSGAKGFDDLVICRANRGGITSLLIFPSYSGYLENKACLSPSIMVILDESISISQYEKALFGKTCQILLEA
jgi:hypothetical protein